MNTDTRCSPLKSLATCYRPEVTMTTRQVKYCKRSTHLVKQHTVVIDSRRLPTEAKPQSYHTRTRNGAATRSIMASNVDTPPDPPSRTFTAGNSVFTCAQARRCVALNKAGVSLWKIKEDYHPHATLEEIVCAIQVGIMSTSFSVDELRPIFFDPSIVCLEVWYCGEPTRSDG